MDMQASFFPGFYGPVDVVDTETGDVRPRRPWKRVKPTSVAVYGVLRETGALAETRALVLCAVAALKNAKGYWPTACEVHRYMRTRKQVIDANPNRVKPRLSELADGWYVTVVREVDGRKEKHRVHVECDVLVRGPKRTSRVTGITCLTWQVKERQ